MRAMPGRRTIGRMTSPWRPLAAAWLLAFPALAAGSPLFDGSGDPDDAPRPAAQVPAVGPSSPAGRPETSPAENDLSGLFLRAHRRLRSGGKETAAPEAFDAAVLQDARAVRYILIPGFMSNRLKDYFGENLRRMRALGLDARVAAIDSEADREGNLRRISALVAGSSVPVVLVGHSRGGALAHDWYRSAPDALKAKVAKLVLLQAAIRGTPVVDLLVDHASLRARGSRPAWSTRRRALPTCAP